ncbi:MAG: hydrogenase [Desulfobacterales bacterium]|nr:hydrogenase [Desulfobacterales bacterium]
MNLFIDSALLILLGGCIPFFCAFHVRLTKIIAILLMGCGCILGFIQSVRVLIHSQSSLETILCLNTFIFQFQFDTLSAFFTTAIYAISLLSLIYSFHYIHEQKKGLQIAIHYVFASLLIVSMLVVVTAADMITFMIAWELMSISSFLLILLDDHSPEALKAGYWYIIFTQAGTLCIFALFGCMYGFTGTLAFTNISGLHVEYKFVLFSLACVGFGTKAGIFPFHVWLPYAHPAAPSHISALMSGVMIKTGIYGILRIYSLLATHSLIFGYILLVAGIFSSLFGVLYALGQHDLKRLLAYHSVENIGIILMGLGLGVIGASTQNMRLAVLGFSGGLLHVWNHAIFKSLLFMNAGMVLHKTGIRSIEQLGGLMKSMRITGITFLIGALSISGLPPFNGFISELLIYLGGFQAIDKQVNAFILPILGILTLSIIGGLALSCFTKVVGIVFLGEPRTQINRNIHGEIGWTMLFSVVVLALLCFGIGIMPTPFIQLTFSPIKCMHVFGDDQILASLIDLGQTMTLVFCIVGCMFLFLLGIRYYLYAGKTIAHTSTWGCGFTKPTPKMQYTGASFASSILQFFHPIAPIHSPQQSVSGIFPTHSHLHQELIDLAEKWILLGFVHPILRVLDKQRWIQHGNIHFYVGYILVTIVVLLFFI